MDIFINTLIVVATLFGLAVVVCLFGGIIIWIVNGCESLAMDRELARINALPEKSHNEGPNHFGYLEDEEDYDP